MVKSLTEAQKHGERMRNRGLKYHGGYTRDQYRHERICRNTEVDVSDENSREEYQRWLKDMKEFIEKLRELPSYDFDSEQ